MGKSSLKIKPVFKEPGPLFIITDPYMILIFQVRLGFLMFL